MVNVRPTRRRRGQKTTKTQARPICRSRRLQLQARRARTSRAVTCRSGPVNATSTIRHMSSSGRRRLSSLFFRRRRRIGSHSTTRRADRKGRALPMSCHLSLSIPPPDERRWRLLDGRPPTHTVVDRMNQAQQWQRKEAQLFEQELTKQHYQ